jgi:hypothetical protein
MRLEFVTKYLFVFIITELMEKATERFHSILELQIMEIK